uniref:Putative salivary lipocalin 4 n=1 Tax=Triatoma infestans TaxID=30076 RepID=A0A023FB25_TRIIF
MKTIFVVPFFGILAHVFATSNENRNCLEVRAMAGFNISKFFNGNWYVTHARNPASPITCAAFHTGKAQGDTFIIQYGNNEDEEGQDSGRCQGAMENEGDQKVPFICNNGNSTFQIDITIIDTDYNNLAVSYRCIKIGGTFIEDNYLVLSRKNTIEEIPESVENLLPNQVTLSECRLILEVEEGDEVEEVEEEEEEEEEKVDEIIKTEIL